MIGLEARDAEIESLRASRRRLVLAADADRRSIERDLHDGVQQHLVALAVNVQLAGRLADTDPAAAKTLLEQMERDVQQALDETAQLAQRIYPPLLEAGGPRGGAALGGGGAGIAARSTSSGASYPPEVAASIYWCWLEALEHATPNERRSPSGTTVRPRVRDRRSRRAGASGLERLRDRVEALGGRLTTTSSPARGTRISGALPLPG